MSAGCLVCKAYDPTLARCEGGAAPIVLALLTVIALEGYEALAAALCDRHLDMHLRNLESRMAERELIREARRLVKGDV